MKKQYLFLLAGFILIGIVAISLLLKKPTQSETSISQRAENSTTQPVLPSLDSKYVAYSEAALANSQENGKKVVLFFHATWCPTCKEANNDIMTNISQIPSDVVIFKTDYDTETALKKEYGIVTQHTFVHIDKNGKSLKKWNGGGVNEILANVQ